MFARVGRPLKRTSHTHTHQVHERNKHRNDVSSLVGFDLYIFDLADSV